MRFGTGHGFVSSQYGGGTVFQFSVQMLPFVKQLSVGFFEDDYLRAAADFRAVEFVAAPEEQVRFCTVNRASLGSMALVALLGVGPLYVTLERLSSNSE